MDWECFWDGEGKEWVQNLGAETLTCKTENMTEIRRISYEDWRRKDVDQNPD
jgi:hypothetical protein